MKEHYNEEFLEFVKELPEKIYQKNDIIIPAGQVHRDCYYIVQGLVRVYYYDVKGHDMTHWFSSEDELLTVYSSALDKSVSIYGIQALEKDTIIKVASFDQMLQLLNHSKGIKKMFEVLFMEGTLKIVNRLVSIQSKTAEQRYLDLVSEHPDIFKRASLKHIASYLGIARQSLSRIRSPK